MKTSIYSMAALLLAATLARADWVLVEKSNRAGQESTTTMKIKDDQVRVDTGDSMSVILGGQGMTMIMHKQKMLIKRDIAALKALIERAAQSTSSQPPAKPVATGQKEKVGEWDTEIYTWEGAMGKGRFWVAKNFPKFDEIGAVQDRLGKMMGGAVSGMAPQATDFGGMVVKSEMTIMGKSVNSQLISAKEETVDAKEFVPPADYREMKMPGAPQ